MCTLRLVEGERLVGISICPLLLLKIEIIFNIPDSFTEFNLDFFEARISRPKLSVTVDRPGPGIVNLGACMSRSIRNTLRVEIT